MEYYCFYFNEYDLKSLIVWRAQIKTKKIFLKVNFYTILKIKAKTIKFLDLFLAF